MLMMFLTLDLYNADLIHSMFRLQITMPMEFGSAYGMPECVVFAELSGEKAEQ